MGEHGGGLEEGVLQLVGGLGGLPEQVTSGVRLEGGSSAGTWEGPQDRRRPTGVQWMRGRGAGGAGSREGVGAAGPGGWGAVWPPPWVPARTPLTTRRVSEWSPGDLCLLLPPCR